MDSNFESHSPNNTGRESTFRKPSVDKANRKYRRHSSGSGSDSPSSDGPKHGETRRENHTQVFEGKRKNDERELGMESGRDRYEKGSDSHRHSDRRSYRSSHDHRRYDDYDKYHKRVDEGDRSYNRSSGYSRESSSGTRSVRCRQGSEYDRSGDYQRSTDKYSHEGSDGEEHRGKDKDKEEKRKHKDPERVTSERRRHSSYADGSKSGRADTRKHAKSLDDHKIENVKDTGREKVDIMEKRKHDDREAERKKERFARETDFKEYSTTTTRKSYGGSEDDSTQVHKDKESSPKKFRLLTGDKDNGKEGQALSQSSQMASDKVITEPSRLLKDAESSSDFNAAKVAALKAAEAVNRNLVGGNYMSTDQKKKLLWGGKKTAPTTETGSRWEVPLFSDRERQEKFNKLMGVKGEVKTLEQPPDGMDPAEKQEQLQLELEKQYTAGLRRRDGRTVGLGL